MERNFKIAILDDNANCIDTLRSSLLKFDSVSVVGTAQTHELAKQLVLEERPDLLFLDMEMPEITGLQFLREIKSLLSWPMHVVFYTAYEKYMLEAFRESAFDYLLKPFTRMELQVIMNRFFTAHSTRNSFANHLETLSQILPEPRTFLVTTITGYKILQPNNVGFLEYHKESKRWFANSDGKTFCELKRGTTAEMILSYCQSYVQINQQQIVNFDYLFKIDGKNCILAPPFSDQTNLSISRDYLKAFKERFDLI